MNDEQWRHPKLSRRTFRVFIPSVPDSTKVAGFRPSARKPRHEPGDERQPRMTIGFISQMEWKWLAPEETFAEQHERLAGILDDDM